MHDQPYFRTCISIIVLLPTHTYSMVQRYVQDICELQRAIDREVGEGKSLTGGDQYGDRVLLGVTGHYWEVCVQLRLRIRNH